MMRHLIIFFLLSINLAYAQELQNGLILPEQNEEEICCIYSPKNGFTIYDQPDGKEIGRLTRNVDQNVGDQSFYRIYFVDHRAKTETQIGLEHFQEIAYEIWALAYSERRDGFVKIRYSNQALWLKQSDIESVGFALVEWQSFLTDNVDNLLGYYANDPGLNLREKPNSDSRIIRTLKGITNQISPTNEHNGLWTKVKVIINKEHPCGTDLTEEENIIEELEGWVKIVDDNGLPKAFNPENSKFYVHNEIEINAQPQVVWGILINAKEWHTYYKGAQSPIEFVDTTAKTLQDGLTFNFHTMGLKFQPIINEFVPYERLAWTSRIKSIQGYHAWVIVPTANGCRLITAESQNGFLTFMQKVFQPKKLLKLHDEWLKLIKERAEKN